MRPIWCLMLTGTIAASAAGDVFHHLPPGNIQVEGELGQRLRATVENNLLVLDVDGDFLDPFREPTAEGGYVGLGKLIESLVRFAAWTNDPRVLERKRYVIQEILKTQAPDGYIGMFVPEKRMWSLWDLHEMAYLVNGLTSDHELFQEEGSLAAAKGLADYIILNWTGGEHGPWQPNTTESLLGATGLEIAFLNLARQSKDERYRAFCVTTRNLGNWDQDIVLGRWGPVAGHAYAYLSHALAQMELYREEPSASLRRPMQRALDFLTLHDGWVITGTCGDHECWHDTQQGTVNLGETCTTAYLVRALDNLLRLDGTPVCGDFMERAIYNALPAAQSPDGRKIRYYTPFEGPRTYFDKDTYCCPGNFRRIMSELPGMVYYAADDGFAVNLYVQSSAELPFKDSTISVRQETSYPSDGAVSLRIDPAQPTTFAVRLRIPRWCENPVVQVNEVDLNHEIESGSWLRIEREWVQGDVVSLNIPMTPRLVRGTKAQAGRVAVMYGPRVFCLNRARNTALQGEDLRLITIDPASLQGPFPDGESDGTGLVFKVNAWRAGSWYPHAATDWELTLTEYPDPGGEAIYFSIPSPQDGSITEDALRGVTIGG